DVCPANTFKPATTTCRPAVDECDAAELCTGTSAHCPADGKVALGTVCTDDGNPCSLDECDGLSDACQHPAGNADAVCYPGSGDVCDPPQYCTGASTTCPAPTPASSTVVCRPAAGECDQAEMCPGVAGAGCPADGKQAAATACTDDGNPCTTDTCDGTSDTCQHPTGNAGAVCRHGSGDVCDPDETCTGTSATCPSNAVRASAFVCRAAAGECDQVETCPGIAGQACPADQKKASHTACTEDTNPCTLDQCDGTHDTCQHPAGNAGTECRPTAGACDVAE